MWKYAVLVTAFLVTAFLVATPAAQAAPVKFYIGGSLGDGIDLESVDIDVDLPDLEVRRNDETWKVFGGVGIGRFFGVEGAWHDFGRVTCCEGLSDAGFAVDVEGISVSAIAGIPISRFRLFAKAGLLSWEADGRLLTLAGPVPLSLDGEDPMGGVGADFNVTRHLTIRAEWELFQIAEGDLDVASVGLQYRF